MFPRVVISGFEIAIFNAVMTIYPTCIYYFCTFHFGQSVWRKLQENGLQTIYKNDQQVQTFIRNLLNLAFVPPHMVQEAYAFIYYQIMQYNCSEQMCNFLKYFESTYLGAFDETTNTVKSSLYNINNWSAYDRVINCMPRTTNAVESWHRTLNARVDTTHPNIARFIVALQQEEEIIRLEISRLKFAFEPTDAKRLSYEHKLRIIVMNSQNYTIEEFLYALKQIIKWKLSYFCFIYLF